MQFVKSKNRQQKIAGELALALEEAQTLTVDCNCDDCVVVGDANRLKQIIVNIASNAIKYTPAGGTIHLKMEALPDRYYRFTCSDNGIGLNVDWAENGKVGVELYQESGINEYFAVFMDMQMSVMDGLEATKLIRNSNREDHSIPIFAMTANTFTVDRQKCRDSGMNGYIPKPVSLTTIKKTLDRNINQL